MSARCCWRGLVDLRSGDAVGSMAVTARILAAASLRASSAPDRITAPTCSGRNRGACATRLRPVRHRLARRGCRAACSQRPPDGCRHWRARAGSSAAARTRPAARGLDLHSTAQRSYALRAEATVESGGAGTRSTRVGRPISAVGRTPSPRSRVGPSRRSHNAKAPRVAPQARGATHLAPIKDTYATACERTPIYQGLRGGRGGT
jgi:hypothetical protein